VAVLATCCIILEIRVKREIYRIIEKICLFMLGIVGLIVGILGLISK